MSSAAAGGANKASKEHNEAIVTADQFAGGEFAATSAVSAEAQQGDGPAAASASGSGTSGGTVDTTAVAVSCNGDFAVAACPIGVVAVGLNSASAASEMGVVAVGMEGAAATSNSANSSEVTVRSYEGMGFGDDRAVSRMLGAIRGELNRLSADTAKLKDALAEHEMAAAGEPGAAGAEAAPAKADTAAEAASGGKRSTTGEGPQTAAVGSKAPAAPDGAKPHGAKMGGAKPDGAKTDGAKTDGAKTDGAKTGGAKPEADKSADCTDPSNDQDKPGRK
jgi:hypothetical protein